MRKLVLVFVLSFTLAAVGSAAEAVTIDDAEEAIRDAEQAVMEMRQQEIPTRRVNDSLQAARTALQRAIYAEFLQNSSTGEGYERASIVLEGRDIGRFTYERVLEHTGAVTQLQRLAFRVSDKITAAQTLLDEYQQQGLNTTEASILLDESREAFDAERFQEAENIVDRVFDELDARQTERSIAAFIAQQGASFYQIHKQEIWMLLSVLTVGISFTYWYYQSRRRAKQHSLLISQRQTLRQLTQEAQKAYYQDESISKSLFQARISTYRSRLNQVEDDLSLFEDD